MAQVAEYEDGFKAAMQEGNTWRAHAVFFQVRGMVMSALPSGRALRDIEEATTEFERALERAS